MIKMAPAPEMGRTGLTAEKAQMRLAADGPNELATTQRRSPFRILLDVLKEPMLVLLLVGGVGSVRQAGVNSGMAIRGHRSGGLC